MVILYSTPKISQFVVCMYVCRLQPSHMYQISWQPTFHEIRIQLHWEIHIVVCE